MKKLKKQIIGCCVISLLFSIALFVFTFITGIEDSRVLLFFYRFFASTNPIIIVLTIISIVRLKVEE